MTIPFSAYCVFTAALAIAAVAGISPLLWDAAGYVEYLLGTIYLVQ